MTTEDDRTTAPFLMVPCVCGRTLRARWEQVGGEICCWDCRQAVKVLAPRHRRRVLGRLLGSVADVFGGQGTDAVGRAALLLAASLAVPYVGVALAAVLLSMGALAYEDLVQNAADPHCPFGVDWRRVRGRLAPARRLGCVLFGVGTVGSLWVVGAGLHRPPHLNPTSLAALALCWLGLPLCVAAGLGARPRDGLAALARHPLATLGIVAIVPAALAAAEAVILGLTYGMGGLPLLAVDFVPMPGRMTVGDGYAYQGSRIYSSFPGSFFVGEYLGGLRRGYTLLGAIPPSLSLPTRLGVLPMTFNWPAPYYGLIRFAISSFYCLAMVVGLAVQAQCLGVLLHARKLRLA